MSKLLTFLCCLCLSSALFAQERIKTENNLGIEDLVKNIFIKGNCKNVSNITAIGDEALSIGQFENGTNSINVKEGIILSTGTIDLAPGPNIDNEAGFALNLKGSDPDLSQLATDELFDVTGIEFDFVPLDDKVTFRYVFASEEYCEFVGTSFNDVFGFFVSGPGINGTFADNAINVATITTLTGTTESVSINNINHLKNETFYVDNITTTDAQNCEITYVPMFQELIEYDGFTIALTASFPVIPCQTYRIRLVVGDVGDAILDSAVFLESNSFDLGEKANIHAEVPGSDKPIAYEGCTAGQFVFTRNSLSNLNEDCTIKYSISPESEAINGIDFLEIPMSITIPAGDTSAILPITIIEDNIIEGPESLKLELIYDCDCIEAVVSELIIDEVSELSANFEDISVCTNQAFNLTPEIIGGVPPFDLLWGTGESNDTLNLSLSTSTQYHLTITDFCSNTNVAVADINIQNIPTATLMGIYDLCETTETGIPVQLEGNPPWRIEHSIDGIEQVPIENIQTNPFYLKTPVEGIYELIAFNDAYCEGQVMGNAVVESPFFVVTDVVPPSCFNKADGSIAITELDGIPPFKINWNIETEDGYLIDKLAAGTYTLSIIDGNGCFYEESFNLSAISDNINDCASIYIPNSFSPNNDGVNDVFSIFFDTTSGIESIISFKVYNRWGVLLFEQTNFIPSSDATSWTGEYKGKPLNSGVYVYEVIVTFEDGHTQFLSGDVSLLR